ncbi:MAG: hypothetical protein ACYDBJ_04435 [Aggregatilineales bacterium]
MKKQSALETLEIAEKLLSPLSDEKAQDGIDLAQVYNTLIRAHLRIRAASSKTNEKNE